MIIISTTNERLRELRKSLNLTMKAFGEKIGLQAPSYNDIEKGRNKLTERNKKAICQAFNVNPEWLDTGEGEMFLQSDDDVINSLVKKYNLSDLERRILVLYLRLSDEDRQKAMAFIRSLNGSSNEEAQN